MSEKSGMIEYGCGHKSTGLLILDGSAIKLSAYQSWVKTVGIHGDKSLCFYCWLELPQKEVIHDSIKNEWDKCCKELERDIMMQEYLIPRTLIKRWHGVQNVGDKMLKAYSDLLDKYGELIIEESNHIKKLEEMQNLLKTLPKPTYYDYGDTQVKELSWYQEEVDEWVNKFRTVLNDE